MSAYRISERFRVAVLLRRARGERQFQIARQAAVNPAVFSALLNGCVPCRVGDPRIVRIGAVLGLTPDECFELTTAEDTAGGANVSTTSTAPAGTAPSDQAGD